jgi:hypothetical protein
MGKKHASQYANFGSLLDLNRFFYLKNCFESMPVSAATLIGIFLFKVNLSFSS